MKKYIFLFSISFISLTSCINPILISSTQPNEIETLTIVAPDSEIYLVEKGKGNKSEYSEELSKKAGELMLFSLQNHLSKYHKTKTLKLDSASLNLVNFQLDQMSLMVKNKEKDEIIEIPPSVDSIMTANDIQFAAFVTHSGFSREHGNYGLQVAKGMLLGIVTLGTIYYVPLKALSSLDVCIIDGEKKSIVYYNSSHLTEVEPVDRNALEKQIYRVFKKYYLE